MQLATRLRDRMSKVVYPNSPSASSMPFVEYAKWSFFTHFTPAAPWSLDIQTIGGCNARCTFCGVGREENKIMGTMGDELYEKIVDEAFTFPFLLQINPYLLNDPLLDRNMPKRVEYIAKKRDKKKRPKIRLITNAGLLDEKMAYNLLHSGLDEINISFNSIIPEIYEKYMRPLKYEKTMGHIEKFMELRKNIPESQRPSVSVWTVLTKPVEDNLENEKAHWKKLGIKLKARKLDNRALSDLETADLTERSFKYVDICPIPFWRAWIMNNGDMIMCCVDQERSSVLGNCSDRSIKEIWMDKKYQELRKKWRTKQLGGLLCETCKGT